MSVLSPVQKAPARDKGKEKSYMNALPVMVMRAEKAKKKRDFMKASAVYQDISARARAAGDFPDAVKYAVLSAECCERAGKPFKAGWAYRVASLAARDAKDAEKAVFYASTAAGKFQEAGSIYAAKWCYLTAAEVSKEAGKPDDALKFFAKARKIEDDDDTANEMIRIRKSVSHPVVDQYAEKKEIYEGEEAKFEIVIENHSKEALRKVEVGDRNAKIAHEIEELPPGEISIFSYSMKGKAGIMSSPYSYIMWQDGKGNVLDFELEQVKVKVRPKLLFTPSIEPEAVVNNPCKLVLLVKNLSSIPLFDVTVDLTFTESARVPHPEPKTFPRIASGEEYGASWGLMLSVPGRHRIAQGNVQMHDEAGTEFTESTGEIMIGVHPREGRAKKGDGEEGAGLEKRHADITQLMKTAEKKYLERKLDEDSFRKIMQEYGREKAELEMRLKRGES